MKDLTSLDALYRHMEWADAAVWRAVLAHEGAASDEQIDFLLHHIHTVQSAFYRIWRGDALEFPGRESFDSPEAVCAWGRSCHADLKAFLPTVEAASLASIPDVPWTERFGERLGRTPVHASLGDTLLQVALHTLHHRAQVSARLRALGGEPPLIDFIAWAWMDKPDADWPI